MSLDSSGISWTDGSSTACTAAPNVPSAAACATPWAGSTGIQAPVMLLIGDSGGRQPSPKRLSPVSTARPGTGVWSSTDLLDAVAGDGA